MKKPNLIERALAIISPRAALRRYGQRRAYEAAQTYITSDWIGASGTSANAEVGAGLVQLQRKSRDLARNNPYAVRALNVIVSNTVGAGIVPNIKGRNKTQVKKLNELWKQVAETTKCDVLGRYNFYGLQALAMRSVVESGEVLSLKQSSLEAPAIKLLESDFLVKDKDDSPYVQGIKLDKNEKRVSYVLYRQHPGDAQTIATTGDYIEVDAKNVAHVYRMDRPGQVRGVPWSHAAIETLKDFADFQNATLIARKISACLVGAIETTGEGSLLSPQDLKAKRESELQMTPGTYRYLNPGEKVTFNSPPPLNGYAEFTRESMRATAAAYGTSFEALTGDYSQVNFSSARMGHMEFRRNLEFWRWNLLIPQFCDPYFQWFLEWANARGHDTEGAYVEWVPPAHTMIDPVKEVSAEKEAVLAGFKSRSQVIRESGNEPDSVREEIRQEREADSVAGLKFDTNVSDVNPPANSAEGNSENEQNEEDASGSSDPVNG